MDSWEERESETEDGTTGNQYYYDNSGQLTKIENANGDVWTLTRGSPVSSVMDLLGRLTTYVYDGGRLQRIVDVHGRATTFVMDSYGNLVKRITPELCVTELVYGTDYEHLHQLRAVIGPDGSRTTFSYDDNGWCTSIQQADGASYGYSYLDWDTTEITDPAGNVTRLQHDGTRFRRIAAIIDPLGNRTTTVYDAAGRPAAMINPWGYRTTSVYDEVGRSIATMDALGNATSYTYDSRGNRVATIDPLGNTATAVYDAANRPVATIDALGARTTTVYDSASRPVAQINPLGAVSTTVYDTEGRAVAAVDALSAGPVQHQRL